MGPYGIRGRGHNCLPESLGLYRRIYTVYKFAWNFRLSKNGWGGNMALPLPPTLYVYEGGSVEYLEIILWIFPNIHQSTANLQVLKKTEMCQVSECWPHQEFFLNKMAFVAFWSWLPEDILCFAHLMWKPFIAICKGATRPLNAPLVSVQCPRPPNTSRVQWQKAGVLTKL